MIVSILALRTAYDEKSLFPAYIREFESKMKNYHALALSNQQVMYTLWGT